MLSKPQLVDAALADKLRAQLQPAPVSDYWASTRNVAQHFYHKHIIPNWFFFLVIGILAIYLLIRRRNKQRAQHLDSYSQQCKKIIVSKRRDRKRRNY